MTGSALGDGAADAEYQVPILVLVNVKSTINDVLSYAVSVGVQQSVLLVRYKSVMVFAATRRRSAVNGIGTKATIRETLDDLMDQLANDWLAVNLKKP